MNRETRQARRVLQWIQDQGGFAVKDLSNALRDSSRRDRHVIEWFSNSGNGFLAMEQDGKAGVIRLIDKTEFPN